MSDHTFGDVLISLLIGGFLGWVTGGFWNMLQGRTWMGKRKKHG